MEWLGGGPPGAVGPLDLPAPGAVVGAPTALVLAAGVGVGGGRCGELVEGDGRGDAERVPTAGAEAEAEEAGAEAEAETGAEAEAEAGPEKAGEGEVSGRGDGAGEEAGEVDVSMADWGVPSA